MFDDIFLRKKVIPKKLEDYGFQRYGGIYQYSTDIMNHTFRLEVRINKNGVQNTILTEAATGEEYVLYKTNAAGAFVGEVRTAVEAVLHNISDKCCDPAVFKAEQSTELIEYVRQKYGDELEYLWETSPDNAVWRRKDNEKWYGVLLTVSRRKLGIKSDELVEIIDLKSKPGALESLIDNTLYHPGWHMNKKHWYTIILDGSVPLDEICRRIDESYLLVE